MKQHIKFFTPAELDTLLSHATTPRAKAILYTLATTGLRVHELAALPREPFLDPQSQISLELPIIGKGKRQRVIFFSPTCLNHISHYLAAHPSAHHRLFPYSIRTIQRLTHATALSAGLQAWPHKLRHTFATTLLRNKASIFDVKEFLGHSSVSTTSIYLHVTNDELRQYHTRIFA